MRLQNELAVPHGTPTAYKTIAVLAEVDWPLELIEPSGVHYLTLIFINENE